MIQEEITILNGRTLPLYPLHIDVTPCEDIDLLASNAWLIIANASLIFSDSRLFLSPIDMHCGLAYSGAFKPVSLGGLLEWWLHHPQSRDADGNPVIRLSGSPLSGCNKCTSATPDGKSKKVVLRGYFNLAFRTFLNVCGRYKHLIGQCEAYPLDKVIAILKGEGVTEELVELRTVNEQLRAKLDNLRHIHENLKEYMKKSTEEYLRAILAPHIEECKALYRTYKDIEEHFYAELPEMRRPKQEAKQRLKNGEITQEEYRKIRDAVHKTIREDYKILSDWWLRHFTALYHDNARFFTPKTINQYLNEEKK